MDSNIQKLLNSIREHQAEIAHDLEMLRETNPELDDALFALHRHQEELVSDIEKITQAAGETDALLG